MYVENEGGSSRPMSKIVGDILLAISKTADKLGVVSQISGISEFLDSGPSYARQRNIYRQTSSYKAVVSSIAGELESEIEEFDLGQVGM